LKNAGDTTTSPERTMKQTMLSGGGSNSGQNAQGSLIVDLLLFGEAAAKKKGMNMTSSFHNTMSSNTGVAN